MDTAAPLVAAPVQHLFVYLKNGGRWRDHERWAILAEEWHARASGADGSDAPDAPL